MSEVRETEADAIARLAREHVGSFDGPDGRSFIVHPAGAVLKEISDPEGLFLHRPRYISQQVVLQSRDSLVDYVNRYKTPGTVLFADKEDNAITAVLDYHDAALNIGTVGQTSEDAGMANHTAHRGTLKLPLSEEWKTWTAIDGELMDQLAFARFIEENGAEITAPPAAEILEVARDLQAIRKANFTKAVRTASGAENFEYAVESNATYKGGIEIPSKFVLGLPVYFGEQNDELQAFLRWEMEEGHVKLGIALHRREYVREARFKLIVTDVAERTGAPTVFGRLGRS